MIARRYEVTVEELRLVSVTLTAPHATVRAEGPDGSVYSADIEVVDWLAVLGSASRDLSRRAVPGVAGEGL